MTKQITLEEALKLVNFYHRDTCGWQVREVKGDIKGTVVGSISGNVNGAVNGAIYGNVGGGIYGDVEDSITGTVKGTINGQSWEFVETPKKKFQRLLQRTRNQELIDAFNQWENN